MKPRAPNKNKPTGRDEPVPKRDSQASSPSPQPKPKTKRAAKRKRTASPNGEAVRPQGFSGGPVSGNGLSDPEPPSERYRHIVRAAFESLPGGAAFIVDRNLRYLFAHGEALAAAGLRPAHLVGRTIFAALQPELAEVYERNYRRALAGESFELEHTAHGRSYLTRGTPLYEEGLVYAVLAVSYDITERLLAEKRLRESEQRFRLLVSAASDIVYRMSADWSQMHTLEGKGFLADTRNPSLTWHEEYIPEGDKALVQAAVAEAVRTKAVFELEHRVIRADGTVGWAFSRAIPVLDERGEIAEWFGAASDITGRKRAEANATFLDEVSQELAKPTSINATMNALGEKIAAHLGLSAVAFAELDETAAIAFINHGWHRSDVPSLLGTYRMEEFMVPEVVQDCRAGKAVIIRDVFADPRTDGKQYAAINIGSFVSVPLVRGGVWRFLLVVYRAEPHDWRDDEIEVARELANRVWTRLERARAEEALRESEARLQLALGAVSMGTFQYHIQEDRGEPDGRMLELFGLPPGGTLNLAVALGKLIHPDDRAPYAEAVARATDPGGDGKLRADIRVLPPDGSPRWLAVTARVLFEGEPPQASLMYGVAEDISERKRLEGNLAFLADLSAAFAPHLGTEEVMAQVGEKLARHLGLARCAFSVVDDEADRITAIYEWRDDALPSVLGEYRISTLLTDEGRRHYRAGQLSVIRDAHDNPMLRVPPEILVKNRSNAIVDAPYLRDGQWKFLLTAARAEAGQWRSDESELVREVAARLYTRLERAWAEEALRDSEARFRAVSDLVPDLLWCSDPQGQATWYNRRWLEYTGQKRAEALGEGWIQAIHPEDREGSLRDFKNAVAAGVPLVQEHRIRRWDGEYCWFLGRAEPQYGERGEIVQWFGSVTDIHQRKEAEERTREAQRETEAILSSIQDGFVAIDRDWRYIRVNPEAAQMLNLTPQGMLGHTVWELFPTAADSTFARVAQEVMGDETAQEFEEFLPPVGRWLNVKVYPAEPGLTVVFRDISEHKWAEQALRASEAKYRELSESQKRFVNDAAHELRAPLTAIAGNLELMIRFKNMRKADREAALGEVAAEANRLSRLVNDMLALARGDSGAGLRLGPVALEKIVGSAFGDAQSLKGDHTLHLEALEAVQLQGDPDRLKQLTLILLENALKYTPAGGRVSLALVRQDQHAEIRVSDTGIGISEADLARVFERFYRADLSRARDPGGTGLGLPIARWIAEAHGGKIWLESEPGRGTTAVVRLPLMNG